MQKIRKAGREQTLSGRAFVSVARMFDLSDADYPIPGSIWGIDISHWTGIVPDWNIVKASGCHFVIIKAMHGKNITNCFKENYAGAISAEIPVSHYHWLCPAKMTSPGGQARAYADLCKQYPPTMNDVWTDFEWTPYTYKEDGRSVTVTTELDDMESFMSVWNSEYGEPVGIYTSPYYWKEHGSTNPKWLKYPLWIANYKVNRPLIPAPFVKELLWQWSESGDGDMIGTAPGERRVDLNYLYGENPPPEPPEPPPGETMYKVTVVWPKGANERPSASVNNTPVRSHPVGTVLYANEYEQAQNDGSWWIKLENGNYIATFYAGERRATVETIGEPPPVGELPVLHVTIEADGYPVTKVDIDPL